MAFSLQQLGTVSGDINDVADMVLDGDYVYIANSPGDDTAELLVIDVSDSTSPTQVASFSSISNLTGASGIDKAGDYVYLTGTVSTGGLYFDQRLAVIDVSDLQNISLTGITDARSELQSNDTVLVNGDYVFCEGRVIDVSDKANPVFDNDIMSGAQSSDYVSNSVIKGDYLIGVNYGGGIRSWDISDPTSPVLSDTFDPISPQKLDGAIDIVLDGDVVYVVTRQTPYLVSVDVSDPTNMSEIDSLSDTDIDNVGVSSKRLALSGDGNYLHLSNNDTSQLITYDVSTSLISEDSRYTPPEGSISNIVSSKSFVYASFTGQLDVYGSLPSVTTNTVSDVGHTTATGNGNITDAGGEDNDERGFVYSTTSQSDPGNSSPASSAYSDVENEVGTFSVGAFSLSLTGLSDNTTYYVRAYTHNSVGYSYGSEVSFTTQEIIDITTAVTTQSVTVSPVSATVEILTQSYTYEALNTLPTDNTDLANDFSASQLTDVEASEDDRMSYQGASGQYLVAQFKEYGSDDTDEIDVDIEWQSQVAPSTATAYLQIYNYDTPGWETVDTNDSASADTDFTLSANMQGGEYYKDADNEITLRIYQQIP